MSGQVTGVLGLAVHGPEVCGQADPVPGVAAPMNSPEGIQRCDECALYGGDLDAAVALALHVPGGRVMFTDAKTGEVREYVGPGNPDDIIASDTDPWIVNAAGVPVDWLERDLWAVLAVVPEPRR